MIGRAVVLHLAFALALSAMAVADQTTDESADEGLKSLFGRAVAEEVLQIGDLFSFDVANEYLCVLRKPDGDESSIFEVYNIFTREKLWSVQRPARNFRINRGPRPSVVLYHYIPYERINLWVYDLSGEHLFDMPEAEWGLVGSPSGEYFCQNDWDLGSATVWDRYGNELFIKDVQGPDFKPLAFDDTIVLFTSWQEVRFIQVPSGRVIDSMQPLDPIGGAPSIVVSPFNSQALISWPREGLSHHGFYYDSHLRVVWEDEMRSRAAAFSTDGRYLVTLAGGIRDTIYLSLWTAYGRELVWRLRYPFTGEDRVGSWPRIQIIDGLISIPTSASPYAVGSHSVRSSPLFLVRFKTRDGSLISVAHENRLMAVTFANDRVATVSLESPVEPGGITLQEWEHGHEE